MTTKDTPLLMSDPPGDSHLAAAVAAPAPFPAAALGGGNGEAAVQPEAILPAPEEVNGQFWEAPLFASIETVSAGDAAATVPSISTENILAWSKPQFKGINVYFSPDYKPSDETSWGRLKSDLQEAAAQQGFSLVSKGAKGKSAADKLRQVLICARGRTVPNSRKAGASMRPTDAAECCRFRLTVHQDLSLDRYFVKGGQNNPVHKFHDKMEEEECRPKKRARLKKASSSKVSRQSSTVSAATSTNVVWHPTSLARADRWKNHKGAVLWFTGLSGSGKSSVANEVDVMLSQRSVKTYVLDGDNLRHGLCSDLGFSAEDRNENLRRTAEVAKLMADSGVVVLAAFVSPYAAHRERVKSIVTAGNIPFVEIHVKASLATCEKRDPKGLYAKARAGIIQNFTGISDPYEKPTNPDVVLEADTGSIQVLSDQVIQYLDFHGKIEKD